MVKWHRITEKIPKNRRLVLAYWPRKRRLRVCRYLGGEGIPQRAWVAYGFNDDISRFHGRGITTQPDWWSYISLPGEKQKTKKKEKEKITEEEIKEIEDIGRYDLMDLE